MNQKVMCDQRVNDPQVWSRDFPCHFAAKFEVKEAIADVIDPTRGVAPAAARYRLEKVLRDGLKNTASAAFHIACLCGHGQNEHHDAEDFTLPDPSFCDGCEDRPTTALHRFVQARVREQES